jgi:hypothetical protein
MKGNNMYDNMQNIFNQTMARNQQFYNNMQSNANGNDLYLNSFQQTWRNLQPNVAINNTNMNNMLNILSLINFPILVPYHAHHPLINCYTPDRAKQYGNWNCDICKNSYTYNVPSFFCTACQFDLCQKCLLSLQAYQIVIHNYLNNVPIKPNEQFKNSHCINLKVHPHPIVNIQRENTHFTLDLKCNKCIKPLQKNEQFYYCTLCNYCVCHNCYKVLNNINSTNKKFVENPDYLSNDQMAP